jgi:hypothetical protein
MNGGRADGTEYQLRALAFGAPLYLAYGILLLSSYNACGATRAEFIRFYRGASESDGPSAKPIGDLDGGEADAT